MKKLSPMEQKASSKVLDELRKHAQSLMSDKMSGVKKVTVASNSPEGLKKGLSTAEKIVGKSDSDFDADPQTDDLESSDEDGLPEGAFEHPGKYGGEVEPDGDECDSPEAVDAKIAELMKLKEEMLKARK